MLLGMEETARAKWTLVDGPGIRWVADYRSQWTLDVHFDSPASLWHWSAHAPGTSYPLCHGELAGKHSDSDDAMRLAREAADECMGGPPGV